jgi:hypothetical protein
VVLPGDIFSCSSKRQSRPNSMPSRDSCPFSWDAAVA